MLSAYKCKLTKFFNFNHLALTTFFPRFQVKLFSFSSFYSNLKVEARDRNRKKMRLEFQYNGLKIFFTLVNLLDWVLWIRDDEQTQRSYLESKLDPN